MDELEKDIAELRDTIDVCWSDQCVSESTERDKDHATLDRIARLARLGAAVEAMPGNDSIKHVALLPGEKREYEWINQRYRGPGKPYAYGYGLTALEALTKSE
ncbi:MAG: hypothetical protein KGL39_18895 [Patescibacteria group bacterium]|nr:hypothetical protein [Patescibacteria group bacterium]